jgi:lactocepin
LDGAPYSSGTAIATEGPHDLVVSATDCAGLQAEASIRFTIDLTAPVITIEGVDDGQCGGAATPVVTFADDYLASTSLTLDGQPFVSGTAVTSDGVHTLAATATDRAGNASDRAVMFTVDTTEPVITITGVEDGAFYAAAVSPVIQIDEPNLTASTILLDGVTFIEGSSVATEGPHDLVVTATDCAGLQGQAAVHFTVDLTAPVITIEGVVDGQCDGPEIGRAHV